MLPQKRPAARRCGGENERRQRHNDSANVAKTRLQGKRAAFPAGTPGSQFPQFCPNLSAHRCYLPDRRFSARRLSPFAALALTSAPSFAAVKAPVPSAKPDAAQLDFFEKNIRPVLAAKCYKCHSAEADKVKGGLLLDTRDGIR